MMKPEELLKILEDLKEKEFEKFKWHLKQPGNLQGYDVISESHLEEAERKDTVDVMVKTYKIGGCLEMTKMVLKKVGRNDLVEKLSQDVTVPALFQPRPISSSQKELQSNLQDRYMCVQEGWATKKDEQHLDDIYTNLYITAGGDIHINTDHEVRPDERKGKPADTEKPINPCDMFKPPSDRYRPVRTVLTSGNAGIGKTFLVHKFVLDWTERRANQDIHLVFPFTFRQLNLCRRQNLCLTQLIHECITETRGIKEADLNHIFKTLQSSGNTNYDKSPFKLLFILDGLDESQLQLQCSTSRVQYTDVEVTASTSVDMLITNLINRDLLPSARLWITTRPAAANQIYSDLIDVVTEVRGFTDPQKEEYFKKRSRDEEQAKRIISHIKTSRSLHIMCHIPVFCWITATVLKTLLENTVEGELPTSLTEMYIHFLVVQTKLNNIKYNRGAETGQRWSPENKKMIQSLGKLAFEQLQEGNLIFNEPDLTECGIDIGPASVYSGVFTQIFREERGLYQDKVFCFIHLSIQEFLAALHVHLTFFNTGDNLLSDDRVTRARQRQTPDVTRFYRTAITKALESPNGQLDLFLRFLIGLSLRANQAFLQGLTSTPGSGSQLGEKILSYIKKRIGENLSADRCINLFHCLNELNDHSLVEDIQQHLSSGRLSKNRLSPSQWSALGFILLSSEEDQDVFDLKTYSSSEGVLLRLMPLVKASGKVLLDGCNLSARSCAALSSVFSCPSSSLTELDLSNNDLRDSGLKLLSAGLQSPHCKLEKLRLTGCLITVEGCSSLASALSSNPSKVRELDLSYNHPGDRGVKLLTAVRENPRWSLKSLRLKSPGEQWLKPGLRKYFVGLTVDTNTINRFLGLSDQNRKITFVTQQRYPDHPDRFAQWPQVLCSDGLKDRYYWEVEWSGEVYISVAYKEIRRREHTAACWFGRNDKSWSLRCASGEGYCVYHDKTRRSLPLASSASHRVAVYLDYDAGTLSFYDVSTDGLIHLHTFNTTFSERLYPGFGLCWPPSSSVSLPTLKD